MFDRSSVAYSKIDLLQLKAYSVHVKYGYVLKAYKCKTFSGMETPICL